MEQPKLISSVLSVAGICFITVPQFKYNLSLLPTRSSTSFSSSVALLSLLELLSNFHYQSHVKICVKGHNQTLNYLRAIERIVIGNRAEFNLRLDTNSQCFCTDNLDNPEMHPSFPVSKSRMMGPAALFNCQSNLRNDAVNCQHLQHSIPSSFISGGRHIF